MPLVVDDAGIMHDIPGIDHRVRHLTQEQIRRCNGNKTAVLTDGNRAGNADLTRERILQHVREEDRVALCGPQIPRALPDRDGQDVPLLIHSGAGLVVNTQHIPLGHGDIDGTGAGVAVQRGHQVGQIG